MRSASAEDMSREGMLMASFAELRVEAYEEGNGERAGDGDRDAA